MTVGEKIKSLRLEKGLSQVELAEAINESKQTIYKYETGIVTNIPLPKIEALAKVLGVSPDFLAPWSSAPKSNKEKLSELIDHMSREELVEAIQLISKKL